MTRTILTRFLYLFGAQWFREGLQTLFLLYLARISAATYGEFMLAFGMGHLIRFFAEFGLNQHLTTILAGKTARPMRTILEVSGIKAVLLVTTWTGVGFFLWWQQYPPSLTGIILVISSGISLEALANTFFVTCQAYGRQDVEARLRSVAAVAGFSFGLTALALGAPPLVIALFKPIETLVAIGASATILFRRKGATPRAGISPEVWTRWKGSVTFTLMAACAILYNKMNMFFLQHYAGATGVAQYNATWQIIDGLSIAVSAHLLGRVLFPILVRLWSSSKQEFYQLIRTASSWLLLIGLTLAAVLSLESDRIIHLIYGSSYAEAAQVQPLLSLAIPFAFAHNLAAYVMIAMKKEKTLLAFYIAGLGVNAALCLTIIPENPLWGTCVAIVATKGIMAVLTFGYAQLRTTILPVVETIKIVTACIFCWILNWILKDTIPRLAMEMATILPLLLIAVYNLRSLFRITQKNTKIVSPPT